MPTQMVLGRDVIDASMGNARYIAGITIDNPSGSFLFVTGINQYVPPYVLGWSFPVDPQQPQISIKFVDSPSGSKSNLVGTPPSYTLSDTPVPAFPGFPSGSGARVTQVPPFSTIRGDRQSDEPKNTPVAEMLLDPVSNPIILREISGAYDFVNGDFSDGYYAPQAAIQFEWQVASNMQNPPVAPFTFQWMQQISLETPYVSTQIPDGAVRIAIGQALFVTPMTEPGGGRIQTIMQAAYYEEVER
jgi:hypothetical protein